ncbi:hypothetical protein D7B24_008380 [Verticillium nonalfalfae]|uniref:Wax synthase domain-containing protein n=1 Tax=Verticillium nonalfalfae TaxID=1051616 RepID=A0A3M9Y607_9PEZI|nr:uncharacterized protein D7B24_008380 [Verticillium nonalfalfae]RNJ55595.1 hypothetical protein D7B24_008380 [Verticillium nonalfalfae]
MTVSQPEALAAALLAQHRAAFKADVAAGRANPLNIPYHFIPAFVLPILYMAVPHTKRPWLYAARWLVLAVVILFNLDMVRTTSSSNVAIAYVTGLWAVWSIMHNLTMLVWMRPQFDAERVRRHPKVPTPASKSTVSNGHAAHSQKSSQVRAWAPGADVEKYDYTWQAFPASAPFSERLYWSFELFASFRGAGWSWAIPTIPSPQRPEKPLSGEKVRMDTVPLVTHAGYATYPTERAFNVAKLRAVAVAYLALDVIKVAMMKDPYFVLGSTAAAAALPLPRHLALLPLWLVPVVRHLMILFGLYTAIAYLLSMHDLIQRHVVSRFIPARAELWQYSSVFGSPVAVLDRGLAGFWSAWWHQTFRIDFAGPGAFLVKMGHLAPQSPAAQLIGLAAAFVQSGLLHGCGSFTAVPRTTVWYPMVFFALAGLGVAVQRAACRALAPWISGLPRSVRRAGNLAFVVLWLHATVWPVAEDFAMSGVWLFEPAPVSFVRLLGGGQVDHAVWRIDWDACPHWIKGRHWWQSGFGG